MLNYSSEGMKIRAISGSVRYDRGKQRQRKLQLGKQSLVEELVGAYSSPDVAAMEFLRLCIDEKMSTFGLAAMNPGTFYRTLRQMEKDGIVSSSWDTSEGGPARRVYSITDAGEAYLHFRAQSLNHYQRMMEIVLPHLHRSTYSERKTLRG